MKQLSFRIITLGASVSAKALWYEAMIENAFSDRALKYHDNIKAAILEVDDEDVSAIFYVDLPDDRLVVVTGEYTRPQFRNREYFSVLFSLFCASLKADGDMDNIQSGYFKGDEALGRLLERLGYKTYQESDTHVRMRFWVQNPWRVYPPVEKYIGDMFQYMIQNKKSWLTRFLDKLKRKDTLVTQE